MRILEFWQALRRYREARRQIRHLRRMKEMRVIYIGSRPDPKCIVHNEPR